MSKEDIFSKGNYQPVTEEFRTLGLISLKSLTEFQEKFEIFDTDTTVNSIRDAIVANYLGFDLLNHSKHGFDAKCSKSGRFLEIKQTSIGSKTLQGTWNDTNEEKARAFSDPRLFTAVAVWKGASDLQYIAFGQNENVGHYLLKRVQNRKEGSRSTQHISVDDLIRKYDFDVITPPDKTKQYVVQLLASYNRKLADFITVENVKSISDI
jgi:hypothetical protein